MDGAKIDEVLANLVANGKINEAQALKIKAGGRQNTNNKLIISNLESGHRGGGLKKLPLSFCLNLLLERQLKVKKRLTQSSNRPVYIELL
jgi:hypothetical protein